MKKTIILLSIILLILLIWIFAHKVQSKPLTNYGEFPSYELTDLSGEIYDFDKKKIKIIAFYYSRCPDICPLTIHDLTKLYTELERKKLLNDVDIVTITLDPEHDTNEVIKQYIESFQIPADHWYFLTGSSENITKMTDELGFYREEIGGYWSHSTTIYVLDYENKKRTFHHMSDPNEPLETQKIIRDIVLLKKEKDKVEKE